MKQSRRYLLGTLLGAYGVIFLFIGGNRATESLVNQSETEIPRTSPEELAAFTGFDRINTTGDFILDVTRGEGWSVAYTPPGDDRGSFDATMDDGELVLRGFNNSRSEDVNGGRVRITLPHLVALTAQLNARITVSGFAQDSLRLTLSETDHVNLEDLDLEQLIIEASFVDEIALVNTSADDEQIIITPSRTTISR